MQARLWSSDGYFGSQWPQKRHKVHDAIASSRHDWIPRCARNDNQNRQETSGCLVAFRTYKGVTQQAPNSDPVSRRHYKKSPNSKIVLRRA